MHLATHHSTKAAHHSSQVLLHCRRVAALPFRLLLPDCSILLLNRSNFRLLLKSEYYLRSAVSCLFFDRLYRIRYRLLDPFWLGGFAFY